jgi:tetratricopeptide (TPR) repeat protein
MTTNFQTKNRGLSLFIGLFLMFYYFNAVAGNPKIDSLQNLLLSVEGEDKVKILNELSEYHRNINTIQSLYFAKEAYKEAEKLKNPLLIAYSANQVGILLRNKGETEKAIEHFIIIVRQAELLKDNALKADALHKISVSHSLVNDYSNALTYIQQEIPIWRELNNEKGLSRALNSLGLVYLQINKLSEAKEYLEESLILSQKSGDIEDITNIYINLADLELKSGKPNLALEHVYKSLEISQKQNNKFGIANAYLELGKIYRSLKQYDKALESVNKGIQTTKELEFQSLKKNYYELISTIYEEMGDFKMSLIYYRMYNLLEDSLNNTMSKKKIAEIESSFENEQQQREITVLTEQNKRGRIILYFSLVMTLLVAIVFYTLFNRFKAKQEAAGMAQTHLKEITKRNDEIAKRNFELARQNEAMSIQKEEIERKSFKLQETVNYAQQVLSSLLPENATFLRIFKGHFLVNMPKDELSGDFCWYTYQGDSIIVVIADCTEHGVPGAFNTVIVNSLLVQIINETRFRTPAEILQEVNRRILKILNRSDSLHFEIGMDMAVMVINPNNNKLVYAGANMPIYVMTSGKVNTIQPDKVPLGGSKFAIQRTFNNHRISIKRGDKVFVFTDGYKNQFGGVKHTKYLGKNLYDLLLKINPLPLQIQRDELVNSLKLWQGEYSQTDDILIFGVEV